MGERDRLLEIVARIPETTVALVGDLVLDRFVLGTPKRVSREAPVIILRYEGQRDLPGGAANALANLAALGVRALAVGVIGDDEPGESLCRELEARGVDTGGVLTVPGFRTPTKVRILGGGPASLKHQMARYDIEDQLPAEGPWRERLGEHAAAAVDRAQAVAISDYGYGTVQPASVASIREGSHQGLWVCLDSRHRLRSFPGVDGATPNLQELEACVGRSLRSDGEVQAAAEELRSSLGLRFLLATRGNLGMTLVEEGGGARHIPVFGTDEVADVTGAGDTVLATLVAGLAAGAEPAEAAVLANIAGGLVVMKLGTATVSARELRDAVRSLRPRS